jgi:GT2 family glycosyltransferase
MNTEVSVIIVSWNCREMLAECLRSIQDNLPPDTSEIIVVDNASSDGTAEAIRRAFPYVNLIESGSNVGFAQGNNLGLQASHGNYLCLINPDVIVEPGCIRRLLKYLEEHPDVGMAGPQIVGPDGVVQRSCMRTPTLWNQFCRALALDTLTKRSRLFGGYLMSDFAHDEPRDVDIINGCFWVLRRGALTDVGLMDPRFWMYADDLDWCLRFHIAGWSVVFYPAARAVHYGGGSSRHVPVFCYLQMHRADLQYWRKYHGLPSYCCYWTILLCAHTLRSAAFAVLYVARSSHRSEALIGLKSHLACMHWLSARASE